MVCPWPVLSPQTVFAVSRLKEEDAAGANKLKINAINRESKKEKKKNPSPAEGETFSYAYCCIERDCTFFLVLLGFDLIFRDKKYRQCLNFLVIKNAYSLHICSCMYAYVYICVLLLATLDVGSDLA